MVNDRHMKIWEFEYQQMAPPWLLFIHRLLQAVLSVYMTSMCETGMYLLPARDGAPEADMVP